MFLLINIYPIHSLYEEWKNSRLLDHRIDDIRSEKINTKACQNLKTFNNYFNKVLQFIPQVERDKFFILPNESTEAQCQGSLILSRFPIIRVHPNLRTSDPDACGHLIKHELAHLLNNDSISTPVVTLLANLVCSISLRLIFPEKKLSITCLAALITFATMILWRSYRERKADDFAIEHSSLSELKGAIRILRAARQIETELTSKPSLISLGKYIIRHVIHPSHANRLAKLNAAIEKLGETYSPTPQEIDKLKFLLYGIREIQLIYPEITRKKSKTKQKT